MGNLSETTIDSCTDGKSLYAQAQDEVNRHKWIRSQEAGRDLGEEAVFDWVQKHWHDYVKARWLEHIEGSRFWVEMDRSSFGVLRREFPNESMLEPVLARLKAGEENLDIIVWACEHQLPTDRVRRILNVVDINKIRLFHFFSRNCHVT